MLLRADANESALDEEDGEHMEPVVPLETSGRTHRGQRAGEEAHVSCCSKAMRCDRHCRWRVCCLDLNGLDCTGHECGSQDHKCEAEAVRTRAGAVAAGGQ